MYIKVWRDREEDKQNIIPDSLKQNTSKCCVTEARHVTKPVWFLPQVESALMRGMTAKCSSIQPNLRKTKQNNDLTTSLHVFFLLLSDFEMTEVFLHCCDLTCMFLNPSWELSALVLLRQCSLRVLSKASEHQKHWRHNEAGWGNSDS